MPKPIRIMRREIKERLKGKSGQQKIDEIENLLEEIPWDVGDYRILKSELKNDLYQMKHLKSVIKSSRAKYQLKKESPQMIIVGATKSGKSYLLNQLTNAGAEVADYPFTTKEPQVGILHYNDINTQLVELPAFYGGCYEKLKDLFSIVRSTDAVMSLVKRPNELDMVVSELEKANIRIFNIEEEKHEKIENRSTYLPGFIVYRNEKPKSDLRTVEVSDLSGIKESIYRSFVITRIYPKDEENNIIKPCLRDKSSPPRTGSTLSLGIGFFGRREMIKNVFPLLNSKDTDIRWGATLSLGLMSINKGDENFKKYLMKSVLDRNDFVRWASSISYGFAFSGRNIGNLPLLKEKINSKDDFNKFFGLIALGLLGSGLNSKNKTISLSLLLPSLIDYIIFESFWWGLWVLGELGFYLYFN